MCYSDSGSGGVPHLFIKPAHPPLHHFSALIEILSMVVNSANDVMCLTKN
ncbi:hypothetical protein CPT_434B_30 [Escherichia phage 434]|nr:hypothetical protein CPT_434_30 [Escherichia phage 434]UMO75370.1 hypothetical protein CPT_434B_30 [Escherichia phage 434]UNA07276.1 hypothetical protein CPT_lambdah434imm21_031 [Escherichia phage Lambda h434 imm21]